MNETVLRIVNTDKTTEYKILYPTHATKSELFAAGELKKYIALATGCSLPSEAENETYGKFISVGRTDAFFSLGTELDEEELNGDGFIVKVAGGNVYLAAATNRGVIYAIYHFLEKYCGVRFLDVNEEYVPTLDGLCAAVQEEKNIPSFKYRTHLSEGTGHTPECRGNRFTYDTPIPVFYARSRLTHEFIYFNKGRDVGKTDEFFELLETVGGGMPMDVTINPTHNNLTYVSPDKYLSTEADKEKNAHMFYILNGKVRDICYADGIAEDGSIEEGLNAASAYLEALKKQILSNPDAVYFNCGQEDLKEFDGSRGMKYGATYMVLRFYNAIAKEIKKWAAKTIPERKVRLVIFAYLFSKEAPPIVDESVVLCDNIALRFADLTSNTNYPLTSEYGYRPEVFKDLKYGPDYFEKWKPFMKNCAEIWYWGYATNYTFYYFYQPAIQKVKPLLTELKELGVTYAMLQNNSTEYHDWKAIMDNYVFSKMLWDITLDPYALREEFIRLYYGVIAEEVLEIVNGFDRVVKELDEECEHLYYGRIYSFYPNDRIPEDTITEQYDKEFKMVKLCEKTLFKLDGMEKKVRGAELSEKRRAKLLERIDMLRLTPYYILAFYRDFLYKENGYKTEYFKDNEEAFKESADRFFAICETLGVYEQGEAKKPEWHKKLFKMEI
ncbi:MAG: DUF4838 domain-containing protein [Clostridia bacterium]|nr:DUF4838 domain-containing protein [Clostridia bacterium]